MPATTLNIGMDFTMSGTASATAGGVIDTMDNFTVGSGNTFTMGAYSDTIGGNLTNDGTFTATGGTIDLGGNFTNNTGATFTGTGGTFTVGGNFTNDGVLTATGSTVTLDGTVAQTIGGTTDPVFNILNISNTTDIVSAAANFSTSGTMTVIDGAAFYAGSFVVSGGGTLTLALGGTLGIGSTGGISSAGATGNIQTTTRNFSTGANYTYNGTANQVTGNGLPATVNNLTINNPGNTVTLDGNRTVSGDLLISAGTFDQATFTTDRTAPGGTLTIANGATLKIGGTNTLPSNYSTHSFGATSTVEYGGTTTTVATPNSSQAYANLVISGSAVTTTNDFTVATGLSVSGSFIAGAGTVTMANGSSISNTGTLIFDNLTIDTGSVTGNNDFTVNGVLTLNTNASATVGNLVMGVNTLIMGASATTVGAGDVTGIVKRTTLIADTTYTFGNQYTTIRFENVGTLPTDVSVKITIGSAPAWKTGAVQRTYDLIQTGASGNYGAVNLHYLDSELNGNTENKLVI
ncbi:MAG: hypothetical protein Q8O95_01500 [bacterium]|nr:hypothetical protein [bacterium]